MHRDSRREDGKSDQLIPSCERENRSEFRSGEGGREERKMSTSSCGESMVRLRNVRNESMKGR